MASYYDLKHLNNPGYYNSIFFPLLSPLPDKRYFILYGSRDTGKSHFTTQKLVRDCLTLDYFKGLLVRKTYNTIKESQYETIKDVIEGWGLTSLFEFVKSPLEIRCKVNGNRFIARGLDDVQKLKSVKDPTHVWYEECDQITEEDFDTVTLSLRNSKGTKTEEWFNFNSGSPKHWLIDRFFPDPKTFEKADGSHTWIESTDPRAIILHTTYKLNEFLTEERLQSYVQMQKKKPKKYKLHGLGLFGRDIENALWNDAMLDNYRIYADNVPELKRIAVAIDPSISYGEGSDEAGITVHGVSNQDRGYLLADLSGVLSPNDWANRAVSAYHKYEADYIVAEKNQGGEMITSIIRGIDRSIPIKLVHAAKGKRARAEPVAALYEQGLIHHVGSFPELEEQLTTWESDSQKSPDRLDALVWGFTSLMIKKARKRTGYTD